MDLKERIFMQFIRFLKRLLEPFPFARAVVKRLYQLGGYILFNKGVTYEGIVNRITPLDDNEYFFGYYDKSPWCRSGRFILVNKVKNAYKRAESDDKCTICLIDTTDDYSIKEICVSHSWNVQQGCMAQWLGPDFESRIIYNDYRNGDFCSVIYNIFENKEEKIIRMPIYDVSKDGKFALTLDFTRLHSLRRGYGYSNKKIAYRKLDKCPESCCIWKVNLETGETRELLKYSDLSSFKVKKTMIRAVHKVNHIMINPEGTRFMVIHRWIKYGMKYSRLITANVDGTDLYNLSDDTFVSHCFWKNNNEIVSFLRKDGYGDHYYLLNDKTDHFEMIMESLKRDGHCSFSHDEKRIVTDTYPDFKRLCSLYIYDYETRTIERVARLFSPFKYDNDVRCDLHPRWNWSHDKICVDSTHEGKREMYIIDADL